MGLGKFMADHIHQMHSQKSYLAANASWLNAHDSLLCPCWGDEPEMISYAILSCPAKVSAHARHLQGVSTVDQDAPLWFSSSIFLSQAAFLMATGTAFSPEILSSPSLSPVLDGFPLLPCWTHFCGSCLPHLPPAPFRFSTVKGLGFISSTIRKPF